MTAKRIVLGLAALAIVTVTCSPARAEAEDPRGLYGVLQGIYSNFDASGSLNNAVDLSDQNGFGGGVFAGYQANRYLGIEAGWLYLGKAKGDGTDSQNVPVHVSADADGPLVQAIGSYPFLDWLAVNANLGAFFWNSKIKTSASSQDSTHHDNGVGMSLGAGLQAQVHPNIAIRVGYTRFFDVGDLDVNTVMLSAVFNSWEAY